MTSQAFKPAKNFEKRNLSFTIKTKKIRSTDFNKVDNVATKDLYEGWRLVADGLVRMTRLPDL